MYVQPHISHVITPRPRKLDLMNKFKAMTKLHRQSDRLIDSATSATLSKRDAKFVNEFLLLERTEQLSINDLGFERFILSLRSRRLLKPQVKSFSRFKLDRMMRPHSVRGLLCLNPSFLVGGFADE